MLNTDDIAVLLQSHGENPLEILKGCGGYYECPRDSAGKRSGPLVGYAARDARGRQFVGDVYLNFAQAEEYPEILNFFAELLGQHIQFFKFTNCVKRVFCGAPEGGKALALFLAFHCSGGRYVFPEKKVLSLPTASSREVTELEFSRHEITPGDRVILVEDVLNNFSTTDKLITLVKSRGGEVYGIAASLNRSMPFIDEYKAGDGARYPVISLVEKPLVQYEQDHPDVKDDILSGNVAWKPKAEWPRLLKAMKKSQ